MGEGNEEGESLLLRGRGGGGGGEDEFRFPSRDDEEKKTQLQLPKDKFNLAYIVYFTLGTGFILPWNAFITAVDYFSYLYPEASVDRVFAVVNMLVALTFLLIIIPLAHKSSAYLRINVGLFLFILSLLVVPVIDYSYVKGRRGLYSAYYVTVAAVALSGLADALVQGGVIGSAGELPERYMQAVFAGTAASGCPTFRKRFSSPLVPPAIGEARSHTKEHSTHVYQQYASSFIRSAPFALVRRTRARRLSVISSVSENDGLYGFSVSGSMNRNHQDVESVGRHLDHFYGRVREGFTPLPWIRAEGESRWSAFHPYQNPQRGTGDSMIRNYFPQRDTATAERSSCQGRPESAYCQRIPHPRISPHFMQAGTWELFRLKSV